MIELNEFLQPQNAPVTQASEFKNSMQFDSNTDRNSVTFSKIKNFSFNAGTGGTIQLGGTENGNGFLVVKDASGSTMVTIDNTGVTINSGSLTIYNQYGSAVIDAYGLNSQTGFKNSDSSSLSLNQNFATSTPGVVTGGTLNIISNRSQLVRIDYSCTGYITGTTSGLNGYIALFDGVGEVNTAARVHFGSDQLSLVTGYNFGVYTVGAGTTPIYLKGIVNNTPGTMTLYAFNFGYTLLGN